MSFTSGQKVNHAESKGHVFPNFLIKEMVWRSWTRSTLYHSTTTHQKWQRSTGFRRDDNWDWSLKLSIYWLGQGRWVLVDSYIFLTLGCLNSWLSHQGNLQAGGWTLIVTTWVVRGWWWETWWGKWWELGENGGPNPPKIMPRKWVKVDQESFGQHSSSFFIILLLILSGTPQKTRISRGKGCMLSRDLRGTTPEAEEASARELSAWLVEQFGDWDQTKKDGLWAWEAHLQQCFKNMHISIVCSLSSFSSFSA